MKAILILLLILFILIILYLYVIIPSGYRKDAMKPYGKRYIAHRGLFNNEDIPENSIPAFKKAVENGYGIELDIQLTTDNQLVVFHDENLERMTGYNRKVYNCSYEELQQLRLLDTDEKIPLFSDVLKLLNKDTPLIVEIKGEGRFILNTKKTVELLKTYDGLYVIESFNPTVVYYLREYEPQIIRGQLAYNYFSNKKSKLKFFEKLAGSYLLTNILTRPDFIAYDINSMNNLSFRIISLFRLTTCVAWTCQSQEQLKKVSKYYQSIIFDSFIPDKKPE